MATLGTLSILAEIKGAAQVISDLKKIQQQGTATNNSLKQSTDLATRAASDLNSTFGNQSVNVKNINKDFLDLIQTMAILGRGKSFNVDFFSKYLVKTNTELAKIEENIKEIELKMKRLSMPIEGGPKPPKLLPYPEAPKLNTDYYALSQTERAALAAENQAKLEKFNKKKQEIDEKNAKKTEDYTRRLARFQEILGIKTQENAIKNDRLNRTLNDLKTSYKDLFNESSGLNEIWAKYGMILDPAIELFKHLSSVFKDLIVDTFKFYTINFSLAIPAITMLGKAAIKSASDLELMLMKMTGISKSKMAFDIPGLAKGSSYDPFGNVVSMSSNVQNSVIESMAAAKAKDTFEFIKKLAIPSTYTADQIFEAAQSMEAFGLNSQKSLLTAVSLAETFGGTQQTLDMITRMMGKMAAGELPDARAFGKFGMNKELMSGVLGKDIANATGEEMLNAFNVLVKRISSNTLSTLENVTAAKMASLQERMNYALAAIGKPMLGPFNVLIDKVIGLLQKLESSGVLQDIGEKLGSLFDEITKPENWSNIELIVADIAGWFERMVENTKIMVRGFIGMYFIAKEALKIYVAFKTKGASIVIGAMEAVTSGRAKNIPQALFLGEPLNDDPEMKKLLGKGQNYAMPDFKELERGLSYLNTNEVLQPYPVEMMNINQKMYDVRKKLASGVTEPLTSNIEEMMANQEGLPFIMDQVLANAEKQNDKLDKIKDNTKNTADELSLRRAAMGGRGGPLNQLGMSPTQIAFAGNVNMDRSAFQDPTLMNPISMLEKAIVDIVRRNDSKTFRRF